MLENQSPAFGREALQPGSELRLRALACAVKVISPSYPVVFKPFRVHP